MICSVIEHSSRPIISARGIPQIDCMTSYSCKNFKMPTLKMCIRTMTIFLLLFISATNLTLSRVTDCMFRKKLGFRKDVWSLVSMFEQQLKGLCQPRPQGLLVFQYGGGRREDPGTQQSHVTFGIPQRTHTLRTLQKPPSLFWRCKPIRARVWNAPISDRFRLLCSRVSPVAAILENEKILGTRLGLCQPRRVRELVENYTT